jgi:hypothetical protein
MAEVQQVQQLPAPFIEAAGKTYFDDLTKAIGGAKGIDPSKFMGQSFVAGQDPLQTQAYGLSSGLGSYAPYLQCSSRCNRTQQLTNLTCLRIKRMLFKLQWISSMCRLKKVYLH